MPATPRILAPDSILDPAIHALKRGGIVAYPTETFYGLGVDPFNEHAVRRLYALKGRSFKDPVSLIIADASMLEGLVQGIGPMAQRLIEKYWPGPLTLVFKASDRVPRILTGGTGAIGIRVSSCETAKRLSAGFGGPVTATSANPSGKKSPTTAKEVAGYFDGNIDVIVDAGELKGVLGSTVVSVAGQGVLLIRDGDVPFSKIKEFLDTA